MNTKSKRKTLKVFIIFALLTTISSCRALSESLEPGEDKNLKAVKREKPNLSDESAKVTVDPDSDKLTEEKNAPVIKENPNKANNTNTLANANSNSTNANSNSTNANSNSATDTDTTPTNADMVVTHNSFGNIKVGMTVAQASQALGTELVAPDGKSECYYVQPKQGFRGVGFMVISGKIARIDIASKEYATDKGAKIGDTEEKIKSLYKGIRVFPNTYDETQNDMKVFSADENYLIIFETDGKIVTGFRVGQAEEVGWTEGCS